MQSLNVEYLFYVVYHFFADKNWWLWWSSGWFNLRLLSFFLTLFFLAWVIYLGRDVVRLRKEESNELKRLLEAELARAPRRNEAWDRILKHTNSANPNDWKQAIIEADAMLDELSKTMQLPGETLGERLQTVDPADWRTLDRAWEAHRLRNVIAHQGGYELTEREARLAIGHYRAVFEEFGMI